MTEQNDTPLTWRIVRQTSVVDGTDWSVVDGNGRVRERFFVRFAAELWLRKHQESWAVAEELGLHDPLPEKSSAAPSGSAIRKMGGFKIGDEE